MVFSPIEVLGFPSAPLREAAMPAALFNTVPAQDHLGFWANQVLDAQKVAGFLDLDKRDVARIADVSPASVRWDHKIPQEVLELMTQVAVVCALVAQFFQGDITKTRLWFQTKNPLLGNLSPRDMVRYGRHEKLRRVVMDALNDNGMPNPAIRVDVRAAGDEAPEQKVRPS